MHFPDVRPNMPAVPSVEENKKAVLDLYELLQAKPYPTDKIVALFAPTVVSKRIETGTFEGSREDFAQFFKGLMTETFPDAKFTNRRIIGDGDQVWIWALCEGALPLALSFHKLLD